MNISKYAVIVAGGAGSRMQSAVPKQFLEVKGKPLLYYTVQTFLDSYDDLKAIVILPKEYLSQTDTIFSELPLGRIQFVEGGLTRFHSVKNGLQFVSKNALVWVHDGVRCMVTAQLIQKCGEEAMQYGNAIPAIHATDSIRIQDQNGNKSINRDDVFMIQTPQTFKSDTLLKAFEKEYNPLFTDEASVVEADGEIIHLVEGDHQNIKVTRPLDLIMVEYWKSRED
ncbi:MULTISPECIES: 2-C-methyl-D-erythritol 4-phosphate cytidylyltransferase [Chitinophagaceae]